MPVERRLWKCPGCGNVFKIPGNEPDPSLCSDCEPEREIAKPPPVAPPPEPKKSKPKRTTSGYADTLLAIGELWGIVGGIIFIADLAIRLMSKSSGSELEQAASTAGNLIGSAAIALIWAGPACVLFAWSAAVRFAYLHRSGNFERD